MLALCHLGMRTDWNDQVDNDQRANDFRPQQKGNTDPTHWNKSIPWKHNYLTTESLTCTLSNHPRTIVFRSMDNSAKFHCVLSQMAFAQAWIDSVKAFLLQLSAENNMHGKIWQNLMITNKFSQLLESVKQSAVLRRENTFEANCRMDRFLRYLPWMHWKWKSAVTIRNSQSHNCHQTWSENEVLRIPKKKLFMISPMFHISVQKWRYIWYMP